MITICKACHDNEHLRGRPWFEQGIQGATVSDLVNIIKTTGGHGGPPLQYVL